MSMSKPWNYMHDRTFFLMPESLKQIISAAEEGDSKRVQMLCARPNVKSEMQN